MLWRGRRQSTNIADLRVAVKSITLTWGEQSSGGYLIDTDGLLYGGGSSTFTTSSSMNITVVPSEKRPRLSMQLTERSPNLTTGQRETIRQIILAALVTSPREQITITGANSYDDLILWQYATTVLHGN